MLRQDKIFLGKTQTEEVLLNPSMFNRHGVVAGATGTGKTASLKVLAEALSILGVPTFITDIKGDLTGMIEEGHPEKISSRVQAMQLNDFTCRSFPVQFLDVFHKKGHPLRCTVENMGCELLSRILGLTEVQEGVLNIIFRIARDKDWGLIDLKDLRAMLNYVANHAEEYTLAYGHVHKTSVGAILRRLLVLEEQGGTYLFGQPAFDLYDLFIQERGEGMMSILSCQELYHQPYLYSAFLVWLLSELEEMLPEVGDLALPKMVLFFDEAHLMFKDASRLFMERMERVIKLIRSKGIGIFFITQLPQDIPASILSQCATRVQHALRAYLPSEMRAMKQLAESFRPNPNFDTLYVLQNLGTGFALVSSLDAKGIPTQVEEVMICPPQSSMQMASEAEIQRNIYEDSIYGKYEKAIDEMSAFETISEEQEAEQERLEEMEREKLLAKQKKQQEREEALRSRRKQKTTVDRVLSKTRNRIEYEISRQLVNSAKKILKGFF